MRNIARLVAFDVLAPLVTVAALAAIGIVLMWPKWWVAVFAALCVLIAQAAALNFFLLRRDGVTVGTDDDGVARHRHRPAEPIARVRVRRLQVGLLDDIRRQRGDFGLWNVETAEAPAEGNDEFAVGDAEGRGESQGRSVGA